MSNAREALRAALDPEVAEPQPEAFEKAAAILAANEAEGDEPSEIEDTEFDFDFLEFDPTDAEPYLAAHGEKLDPDKDYRWGNTDPRIFPRTKARGWEPSLSGKIRRNELMLMEMPKKRAAAMRRAELELANRRANAAVDRFDSDAARIGGKNFTPFDDAGGPRLRR